MASQELVPLLEEEEAPPSRRLTKLEADQTCMISLCPLSKLGVKVHIITQVIKLSISETLMGFIWECFDKFCMSSFKKALALHFFLFGSLFCDCI